jgi:hypothetical protein
MGPDVASDFRAAGGTRLRRRLGRLGLAGAALGVALVLAELALRIGGYSPAYVNSWGSFHEADPVIGYRAKPGLVARWRTSDFDIQIVHDERGFRRQEIRNEGAPHDLYVFGDSYTWGWGTDQGEGFTDRLSALLPDYHVHNRGLGGSGTTAQYAIFQRDVAGELGPGDVVMVAFCTNDFGDNVGGLTPAVIEPDGSIVYRPEEPFFSPRLIDGSYLFNLLAFRWNYAREVRRAERVRAQTETDAGPRGGSVFPLDDPRMIVTRHYLRSFRDAVGAAGSRFVVTYLPRADEHDGRPAGPDSSVRRSFFHIARELDLEVIDLAPAFRAAADLHGPEALIFGPQDLHWTPLGHEIAARAMARQLAGVGGASG